MGKNVGDKEVTSMVRSVVTCFVLQVIQPPQKPEATSISQTSINQSPLPTPPHTCAAPTLGWSCLVRRVHKWVIRMFSNFLPVSASFCPGPAPHCSHGGGSSTPQKEWRIHVLSMAPSSLPHCAWSPRICRWGWPSGSSCTTSRRGASGHSC